jgi:hypothetical protein
VRVQGADGAKTEGFPGFHASMVHTSPFLFDADADGTLDIGRVLTPCSLLSTLCALLSRALTRAWRDAWSACVRRLATYDGEIIFHSPSGALLPQKLVIPKLSVHKARCVA